MQQPRSAHEAVLMAMDCLDATAPAGATEGEQSAEIAFRERAKRKMAKLLDAVHHVHITTR